MSEGSKKGKMDPYEAKEKFKRLLLDEAQKAGRKLDSKKAEEIARQSAIRTNR